MMKKIVSIVAVLFITVSAFSQEKLCEEKRKGFEAQKVAYFTNYLELTPEEAAVFWPLYNEMSKKMKEKGDLLRGKMKAFQNAVHQTDAEARNLVNERLKTDQEMLEIKKKYYAELLLALSARKVIKVDYAEHTFNKQLLNKMREESKREGKIER